MALARLARPPTTTAVTNQSVVAMPTAPPTAVPTADVIPGPPPSSPSGHPPRPRRPLLWLDPILVPAVSLLLVLPLSLLEQRAGSGQCVRGNDQSAGVR